MFAAMLGHVCCIEVVIVCVVVGGVSGGSYRMIVGGV